LQGRVDFVAPELGYSHHDRAESSRPRSLVRVHRLLEAPLSRQQFQATVEAGERGRVFITIPFDPPEVWGPSRRFHVRGTLEGAPFSGSLGVRQGRYFMPLNKDLQERSGAAIGKPVDVVMDTDEAQRRELPEDLAAALEGAPAARELFDGLSPFYRNQWVDWITDAKQQETRAERLRQAIEQLGSGVRQRQRGTAQGG
jgi:hypothetical protein